MRLEGLRLREVRVSGLRRVGSLLRMSAGFEDCEIRDLPKVSEVLCRLVQSQNRNQGPT